MDESGTKEQWIQDTLNEADEMKKKELESNAELLSLITTSMQQEKVNQITIGSAVIQFRGFLNRALRHKLIRAEKEGDIEKADEVIYDGLAALCTNAPYNDRYTWIYLEEKGVNVIKILNEMMEVISANTASVKNFRGKQ